MSIKIISDETVKRIDLIPNDDLNTILDSKKGTILEDAKAAALKAQGELSNGIISKKQMEQVASTSLHPYAEAFELNGRERTERLTELLSKVPDTVTFEATAKAVNNGIKEALQFKITDEQITQIKALPEANFDKRFKDEVLAATRDAAATAMARRDSTILLTDAEHLGTEMTASLMIALSLKEDQRKNRLTEIFSKVPPDEPHQAMARAALKVLLQPRTAEIEAAPKAVRSL